MREEHFLRDIQSWERRRNTSSATPKLGCVGAQKGKNLTFAFAGIHTRHTHLEGSEEKMGRKHIFGQLERPNNGIEAAGRSALKDSAGTADRINGVLRDRRGEHLWKENTG